MELNINTLIKYLFITLAIALISVTSSAYTVQGSLSTNPKGTYTFSNVNDHKEEVVYEQTGAHVPLIQDVEQSKELKNLNTVAGINAGGHSKLIIKKVDEKNVTIESDRREYLDSDVAELNYVATGVITEGSWADLIANKAVKIELLPQGKITLKSKLKLYLATIIKSIANQKLKQKQQTSRLARLVKEFKNVEFANDGLSVGTFFVGSKQQLTQVFDMKTQFKVRTN